MTQDLFSQGAWVRARDRFIEDLNESERGIYQQSSPEKILYDASATQKRHENASSSRNLIAKLQPLISAIEQYGEALNVYVSAYPLALSPLWGSLRIVLLLARELGKYFEKIVDMFERIGDVLPRFRTYERLFPNNERLIQLISVAYIDILEFCYNAKAVFRRSKHPSTVNLKIFSMLTWKPFDVQFGGYLRKFREHRKAVDREAEVSHMIESADNWALVVANQDQLRKEERENNRNRMLSQLSAVSESDLHSMQRQAHHPGTGLWALKTPKFLEWKALKTSGGLCYYGIPGCGKSILASTIIEDLFEDQKQTGKLVIYYYCSFADPRSLIKSQILGNIMRQLILHGIVSQKTEDEILSAFMKNGRCPAEEKLVRYIQSTVERCQGLFVVVDGLDECMGDTIYDIVDLLIRLTNLNSSAIRVLVTGREESFIIKMLHEWPRVPVDETSLVDDISIFVAVSVRSRIEKRELRITDVNLEREVVTALVDKAHGMFLWIHFQLIDLCAAMSTTQIGATLERLPDGLEETYERILTKINRVSTKARVARKVFNWLACARRPLYVAELQEAIAFDELDKFWDSEKIPDPDLLLQSCQGLVIRNHHDVTVRFAHYTIQQHLIVMPNRGHPSVISNTIVPLQTKAESNTREFHFEMRHAETEVAKLCIAYLNFSDFETAVAIRPSEFKFNPVGILGPGGPGTIASTLGIGKPIMNIVYKLHGSRMTSTAFDVDLATYLNIRTEVPSTAISEKHALLEYIRENWPWHVEACENSDMLRASGPLANLVYNKALLFEFRPWGPNRHFGPHGCKSCCVQDAGASTPETLAMMSMVHWAAQEGIVSLLILINNMRPYSLNSLLWHERYSDETVFIACRNGQTRIIKYLCMSDWRTDDEWQSLYSVLCVKALASGHAETLEHLLSLTKSLSGEQAQASLFEAASDGYASAIRVWLRQSARIIDKDHLNEGFAFCINPCPEKERHIVSGMTALHAAAANGHHEVVQILSEVYPSVDIIDVDFASTPLHYAVKNGHARVVQVLLANGASVKSRDGAYRTPLILAALHGHLAVVKSLLIEGSSIDQLCIPLLPEPPGQGAGDTMILLGSNALQFAAYGGHDNCIEFLVSRGSFVDALTDHKYGLQTALHVAACYGQAKTILALARLGAELKTMDAYSRTAFEIICGSMLVTTAQALLEAEEARIDRPRLWMLQCLLIPSSFSKSVLSTQKAIPTVSACIDGFRFHKYDKIYAQWLVHKELRDHKEIIRRLQLEIDKLDAEE